MSGPLVTAPEESEEPPAASPRGSTHLGGSALLLAATNAANGLHFAFHLSMARLLGPADYGLLAALFAALYAFTVVGETVQTVVARHAARATSLGEMRARLAADAPRAARLLLALAGLWAAASLPLAAILRAPFSVLALFGVAVAATVLLCVTRGALLGLRRFGGYSATLLLEAIAKLGGGLAAVWLGWGLLGVSGAVAASFLAAFAAGVLGLRDLGRATPAAVLPARSDSGYALSVLLATGTVMTFYSLDVVLARAFFPAAVAGQYSLAALIGKGAVLGTLPLARAMFPFAAGAGRSGSSSRVLAATLGLLALCLVPGLVLVGSWPDGLARLAGGPGYEGAAAILLPVAAAFSIMAVSQTLVTFRLAGGNPRFAGWIVAALAAEVALLAACRGSLATYAWGVLAAHAGFLVIAALFARARPAHPPPGAR